MNEVLSYKSYSQKRRRRLYILLLLIVSCTYSLHFIKIDDSDFNGALRTFFKVLIENYLHPNTEYIRNTTFWDSFIETTKMTFLGWSIGTFISLPISIISAYNISPGLWGLYHFGRALIIVARSIHEMIWAILFVSIIGYGPLAGTLALVMMTIGFSGKLFAEEIESINMNPVEAIQSTGASVPQVFIFGILPQTKRRLLGISIYSVDNAFRASTILGFFGAGGMGWHLRETTQTLAYSETAAILLFIFIIVTISELLSASLRKIIDTNITLRMSVLTK